MDEAGRDRLPPVRLRLSSCVDNGARRLKGGQPAVAEPEYVYVTTAPLGYMRRRTFKKTFILADEIQNASQKQVFMLATRLGQDSKLAITGDLRQSDLGKENGLADFKQRLECSGGNEMNGISMTEFTKYDVERSQIVQTVLDLYEPNLSSYSVYL